MRSAQFYPFAGVAACATFAQVRRGSLVHFGGMKKIQKMLAGAFSVLVFLIWLSPAQASSDDLYAAEVPVADDSLSVRNEALQQALRQVVVRLSGSAEVGGNPALGSVLQQAPSLVQQFRYRLDEQLSTGAEQGAEQAPQRYLWARFDKAGLDRALRSAAIPVWSSQRPRVLIWLAEEKAGQRQLLNLEADSAARDALRARAAQRGMPIQLPLMDLLDQSALSAADLWAGYEAAIREASNRYPHDVILTGRLRGQNGSWEGQWTLWDRAGMHTFSLRSSQRAEVLLGGVDQAQDQLAARYAPASGGDGPGHIRVRIDGVDSLAAYGRLLQILGNQEGITRFNARGVQGDRLFLDVWVRGGENALARMLSLGGELFLESDDQLTSVPVPAGSVQGVPGQAPAAAFLPADMVFSFQPSVSYAR